MHLCSGSTWRLSGEPLATQSLRTNAYPALTFKHTVGGEERGMEEEQEGVGWRGEKREEQETRGVF